MKSLVLRESYLSLLLSITDRELVRVITGVRRCGKSALLELYRQHLLKQGVHEKTILQINFEDTQNDYLRDPVAFTQFVNEQIKTNGVEYLHVDEVQELADWSRAINSIRVSAGIEICVTGSNASMFTGESTTYLVGRYIEIPMYPLSLQEFQKFRFSEVEKNKAAPDLLSTYQELMKIGGFPATALVRDERIVRQLNSSLFDSIFARDIALRGQIRNTETFLRVARFVFDNVGKSLSINGIAKTLKGQGSGASYELVERYLKLMEDAHLIYRCQRYDAQGKQWLIGNDKYYFVDPAIRNSLLGKRDFNRGRDLENMVYLELRRRGYEVATGVVGKKARTEELARKKEIDFIATRDSERYYIQVAYVTEDESTLERELAPFDQTERGSRCVLISFDRIKPPVGDVDWIDASEFLAGAKLP